MKSMKKELSSSDEGIGPVNKKSWLCLRLGLRCQQWQICRRRVSWLKKRVVLLVELRSVAKMDINICRLPLGMCNLSMQFRFKGCRRPWSSPPSILARVRVLRFVTHRAILLILQSSKIQIMIDWVDKIWATLWNVSTSMDLGAWGHIGPCFSAQDMIWAVGRGGRNSETWKFRSLMTLPHKRQLL